MTNTEWKKLFRPDDLRRGESYNRSGAVHDLIWIDDTVKATVSGTWDCAVEIRFDGTYVEEMICDCPFAEDGSSCEHIAAVLYALDSAEQVTVPKDNAPLSDILKTLSEEQVRSLLLEIAENDTALENRLRLLALGDDSGSSERIKSEIHRITEMAGDAHGYIDSEETYTLMWDIIDVLNDHVPSLIGRGACLTAFEIVCEAYTAVSTTEFPESEGEEEVVWDECRKLWESILMHAGEDDRHRMYSWFEEQAALPPLYYDNSVLEDVMFRCFEEPDLMERSLEYIRKMLPSAGHHYLQRYAGEAVDLMDKLKYPAEDLERFRLQYRHLPRIREAELDKALRNGDLDAAISLLKDSIEIDKDDRSLTADHYKKLIELYEKTGQTEATTDTLSFYLANYPQYELSYVRKYKQAVSPENWNEALETLLLMPTIVPIKCELLQDEKRYADLFDEVKRRNALCIFCDFDSELRQVFPEETLLLYSELLMEAMEKASSRKQYREVAGHFHRMKNYTGGKEEILLLVNYWRREYPGRRAMLDELNKALPFQPE